MSDREEFEKWKKEHSMNLEITIRDSNGDYQYIETRRDWYVWQNAIAKRQPEIDALKDKLESLEAQIPAQPHHKLDDANIKAIALDCGFKFRLQPDGTEDLNPYVYRFAREILSTIPRAEDIDALRQRLTPPTQEGLDPRIARDFAHTLRNYLFAFNGQEFNPATDSVDRQNLAQALDHLEEAAAMLLNLSERVSPPDVPLYASPQPDISGLRKAADACHKLDTPSQVFFYEQDFYVLSNFSAFALVWRGIRFDTSEAAYHYEKFPDHGHIRWSIRNALSAHAAFKIAEHHKEYRRRDWDEVKVDIMRDILRTKVEQHEYVRRKLLATGDRELIEDSWRDDFWGWGPNRDGKNMLGKLWMEIRENLRVALEGK